MNESVFMSDRLTHFSVSHHHSGFWMFPFQTQKLFKAVGLQPHRPVATETQRARPLTFGERLDRKKEREQTTAFRLLFIIFCLLFREKKQ